LSTDDQPTSSTGSGSKSSSSLKIKRFPKHHCDASLGEIPCPIYDKASPAAAQTTAATTTAGYAKNGDDAADAGKTEWKQRRQEKFSYIWVLLFARVGLWSA
jgi:hypothetical protein